MNWQVHLFLHLIAVDDVMMLWTLPIGKDSATSVAHPANIAFSPFPHAGHTCCCVTSRGHRCRVPSMLNVKTCEEACPQLL